MLRKKGIRLGDAKMALTLIDREGQVDRIRVKLMYKLQVFTKTQ